MWCIIVNKEENMGLFKKKTKEITIEECKEMVEKFMRKKGLDPSQQRLKGDQIGWFAIRGSAYIYIFINQYDNFNSIRVYSPILYLPEENILPFYRKCLELNWELKNCAICVYENEVALVVERPIEGLDPEEVEWTIDYLSQVADNLDNKLADEFGARIFSSQTE